MEAIRRLSTILLTFFLLQSCQALSVQKIPTVGSPSTRIPIATEVSPFEQDNPLIVPLITLPPEPSPYLTPIPSCENEEELESYTSITYPIMDSLTKAAQEATQLEAMSESRARELIGETQQYYLQLFRR